MEVISGHPITCKAESSSIECKLVEDQLLRLMKEPKLPSDDVKLSSDVQDEARDVQDEVRSLGMRCGAVENDRLAKMSSSREMSCGACPRGA